MDIKIEELIEKIKKEGIEGAQKTSEEMIGAAENEAEQIRKGARQEAEKIIEKAREETGKFQQNAELAIQQAARDARLLLKEDILKLFDRVFKMEVDKNLSETFLKDMLLEIVGKWAGKPDIEVAVSEKDKEK